MLTKQLFIDYFKAFDYTNYLLEERYLQPVSNNSLINFSDLWYMVYTSVYGSVRRGFQCTLLVWI